MAKQFLRYVGLVVVVWSIGCSAGSSYATEPVTRAEAITMADAYRLFVWTPTNGNAFHGTDRAGIRVDTPDVSFQRPGTRPGWWIPGTNNIGVPYMWGGFSSLQEFADGIKAGRYAGDVYTVEKRARLDDAVSKEAVGIDCSGLISRCWKLERSYSPANCPRFARNLRGTTNSSRLTSSTRTTTTFCSSRAGQTPSTRACWSTKPVPRRRGKSS